MILQTVTIHIDTHTGTSIGSVILGAGGKGCTHGNNANDSIHHVSACGQGTFEILHSF
jgi:hypothetical protein